MSVFIRGDERLHHLSSDEVAVELVQLVQPKLVAGVIGILRIVGISSQITKVLQ